MTLVFEALVRSTASLLMPSHHHMLFEQEDDVIGIMNSKAITDLVPLGDRVLIEVRPPTHHPTNRQNARISGQ